MSKINGALSGLKIVACSTAQAGTVPYMLMADLGAEVIKNLIIIHLFLLLILERVLVLILII